MFPKQYRTFRRAIIRRSYFAVYYVIEPEVTTVVAVLDMRRERRPFKNCSKAGNRDALLGIPQALA